MPQLPSLICPGCGQVVLGVSSPDKALIASRFEDCLRHCEACGIGASNTENSKTVTFIYRDPLANIPLECREGASEALSQALNVQNRKSKRRRFGFSTSEDAVTWVVFSHLLHSGELLPALRRIGLAAGMPSGEEPTLLLWGAPIGKTARGIEIREGLSRLCARLKEHTSSFSEPDVIIDLGAAGLIFIEVKYLSGNDEKPADYPGWPRYESASGQLKWRYNEVKASGCYELARNWALLHGLAKGQPVSLVNLGPAALFEGEEGKRLDRFIAALGADTQSRFLKAAWPDFLAPSLGSSPRWLAEFCRSRNLM